MGCWFDTNNVPCGPINDIKQVFDDLQVKVKKNAYFYETSKILKTQINIIGSPMNFSKSKIKYKKSPPLLGEDTQKILKQYLKLNDSELK